LVIFCHKSDNGRIHFMQNIYICKKIILGKVVAIDYGQKRTGIAVSDETKTFAFPLDTIPTAGVFEFLDKYIKENAVECIVVGLPKDMQNQLSESARFTEPFVKKLSKTYPNMPIIRVDERFTSKMATQAIISSGAKKKKRSDKALVDTVSATIILQSYLQTIELQEKQK
jgi:putative Holliday junction resolvase